MAHEWGRRVRAWYAGVEESTGVLCPLLLVVSLIPELATLRGIALAALWLGFGHTMLHFYDVYPRLSLRPFFKGPFAFGAGVLWPGWFQPGSPVGR